VVHENDLCLFLGDTKCVHDFGHLFTLREFHLGALVVITIVILRQVAKAFYINLHFDSPFHRIYRIGGYRDKVDIKFFNSKPAIS
jgi:hypothetical protein